MKNMQRETNSLGGNSMKISTLAIVVISGITLVGCQTAVDELIKAGGVKMTRTELIAVSTDKTSQWASGEGASYMAPDGTFFYKTNSGETGKGTWSVNDAGVFCLQVKDFWGDQTRCNWESYMLGEVRYSYDIEKGVMTKRPKSTMTEGNNL
jgi:Protein of unknown function (DUF995)